MSNDYNPLELQLAVNKLVSEMRGHPNAIAEVAVKTRWALDQDFADHKKEKLILLSRAEAAEARAEALQTQLDAANEDAERLDGLVMDAICSQRSEINTDAGLAAHRAHSTRLGINSENMPPDDARNVKIKLEDQKNRLWR